MLRRPPTNATPILPVRDLDEAISCYRALGFDVERYDETHARALQRGDEVLHLRAVPELDVAANRAAAYVRVRDAEVWHFIASSALGDVVGPLVDEPWGMREFTLHDPSGNLIRIGQTIRGAT